MNCKAGQERALVLYLEYQKLRSQIAKLKTELEHTQSQVQDLMSHRGDFVEDLWQIRLSIVGLNKKIRGDH